MYIGRIIEINSFEAGIANAMSMNDGKLLTSESDVYHVYTHGKRPILTSKFDPRTERINSQVFLNSIFFSFNCI